MNNFRIHYAQKSDIFFVLCKLYIKTGAII